MCEVMHLVRADLIEQLFHNFSFFFFQEKQEKLEKQETFPKIGNLTEGKIFGRLRIPIFGEKNGKYGNTKKCAKKHLEIDKMSADKNGPKSS